MYGLAGLANLVVSSQPAGVDRRTGAADYAAELSCELFRQLDAGLDILGDAAANGYDNVSAGQVDQLLGFLDNLEYLGLDVVCGQRNVQLLNRYSV